MSKVALDFSRPDKPADSSFVESFGGKFEEECLSQNCFFSLQYVREKIESLGKDHNEARPNSLLEIEF